MLPCNAGRALAGTVVVVMVLACSSGDKAPGGDSTLPTVAMGEDSTLPTVTTNNGTCEVDHKKLWGELTPNNIEEALKQAKKLSKKGKSGKHGAGADESVITAICESHEYNKRKKPQLDSGQFVAMIEIKGSDSKYSKERDDVVYLWIYQKGGLYRAQFLSTKGESIMATGLMRLCMQQEAKEEEAHWSPIQKCPPSPGTLLHQHTPWWGCWLGCCYVSDIESA